MKRLISLSLSVLLLLALLTVPAGAIKSVTTYDPEDVLSPEYIEKHTPSSWAVDEIDAARMAGLIPELTGRPGYKDTITRLQFAELTVNMVEKVLGVTLEPAPADTFTDCTSLAVLKAYKAGIVQGLGNAVFQPDTTTNREQIACFIARAIRYIEANSGKSIAPNASSVQRFSDKDKIASWAVESVGLLAANKIMEGTSTTTAAPKSPCTIEQSVLFLYRTYQRTL